MKNYNFFEKIMGKVKDLYWKYIESKIIKRVLKKHDLDFGKYYLEELVKMYKKHKDEIQKD